MALMGLDNIEWTAAILDDANKENKKINKIKTKKELRAELVKLIAKYEKKEIGVDVVFNLIKYIELHYPSKEKN
jgi:uncharacterized protein YtpQ (UPF0354 family)